MDDKQLSLLMQIGMESEFSDGMNEDQSNGQ